MKLLFFDTETTGLVNFKTGIKNQPYPVQLACMLTEGAQTYAVCNVIVNAGMEVPEAASKVHGITTGDLETYGISLATAVLLFLALAVQADTLVAHNIDFDYIVMLAAISQITSGDKEAMKILTDLPRHCTMLSAKPHCKLPGKYGDYKWPTLDEAYRHFVDPLGFSGAHDALIDVKACAAVYAVMESQGLELRGGRF